MRIALTVDPSIPVPPDLYGGIERVVDFLARGLVKRGHHVTLFAHPKSRTPADLVPYGTPPHNTLAARATEVLLVGRVLWERRNYWDIVHSFGRLAALLPILPIRRLPKIQSYQRNGVPWRSARIATTLGADSICFTGCSSSVFRERAVQHKLGIWHVVFNGVETAKYDAKYEVDAHAPLVFLGRVERIKGAHNAIIIARRAERRLIIAGNLVSSGPDADYFAKEIEPHIDGDRVTYIGPVNDAQKNELLGRAAGLLMPIEWDEPFGIVMIEAFACGTPVIGYRRGSVPEVVIDGVNGFRCSSIEDAVAAVHRLPEIDRRQVRRDCEIRFDSDLIVDAYERLYLKASLK